MEDSPPPESPDPVLGIASEKRPRFSLNRLAIAGLGILILIAGGTFYFLVVRKSEVAEQAGSSPRAVSVPVSQGTGSFYTGSQAIVLADLMGANLSGTAYRSIMFGHIFWAAYITAPDPPEGKFYQMWVVQNEIVKYPAGILYKDWEGYYTGVYGYTLDTSGSYYSTLEKFPNHIAITLETVDDTTMEQKLMEGTFTK